MGFFRIHKDSILVGLERISCALNGLTMNGSKRVQLDGFEWIDGCKDVQWLILMGVIWSFQMSELGLIWAKSFGFY